MKNKYILPIKQLSTPKKILILASSIMAVAAAATYGKWEALTWMHGKEFTNAPNIAEVAEWTTSANTMPKFLKVLRYSNDTAEVLWVINSDGNYHAKNGIIKGESNKDSHIQVEFIRKRTQSGELTWSINNWCNSTFYEGAAEDCLFPFYGAIPDKL
jgi:hypothetical protein